MINDGLNQTSVTAVLIGAETALRQWVIYEIQKSYERGNGLLAIGIHGIRDQNGSTDVPGQNPFEQLWVEDENGARTYLSEMYRTYDWVLNGGYDNFAGWVEAAAPQH